MTRSGAPRRLQCSDRAPAGSTPCSQRDRLQGQDGSGGHLPSAVSASSTSPFPGHQPHAARSSGQVRTERSAPRPCPGRCAASLTRVVRGDVTAHRRTARPVHPARWTASTRIGDRPARQRAHRRERAQLGVSARPSVHTSTRIPRHGFRPRPHRHGADSASGRASSTVARRPTPRSARRVAITKRRWHAAVCPRLMLQPRRARAQTDQ